MGLKLPEDLEVSEWTPATEVDSRVPSSVYRSLVDED